MYFETLGKFVDYSCITVSSKPSFPLEEPYTFAPILAKIVLESYKIIAKIYKWGN